jgi:ABC-type polysaccharide/polyol phosphate export permease
MLSHEEKKSYKKVPNLVTKSIQHIYALAISFYACILRYRTITASTGQMEYYNGFIFMACENIKVLFLAIKNNCFMKLLVRLTSHFWLLSMVPAYILTGIFWDLM